MFPSTRKHDILDWPIWVGNKLDSCVSQTKTERSHAVLVIAVNILRVSWQRIADEELNNNFASANEENVWISCWRKSSLWIYLNSTLWNLIHIRRNESTRSPIFKLRLKISSSTFPFILHKKADKPWSRELFTRYTRLEHAKGINFVLSKYSISLVKLSDHKHNQQNSEKYDDQRVETCLL